MLFVVLRWRLSGLALSIVLLSLMTLGIFLGTEVIARARERDLAEAVAAIVDRGDQGLRAEDEGRLVRVTGTPAFPQPVVDPDTGLAVPALSLRREVESWEVLALGEGRQRAGWLGVTTGRAAGPLGLASAEFVNPASRLGTVPLAPALAGAFPAFDGRPVGDAAAAALAARFPDWRIGRDGDWILLTRGAEPGPGDLRIRYRAIAPTRDFTLVGRQRDGVLEADFPRTARPLPGDHPAASFLPIGMTRAAHEARLAGGWFGAIFLAAGLMLCCLVAAQLGGDAETRQGIDDMARVVEAAGPFGALALVPFALLAAPLGFALWLLSRWMLAGGVVWAACVFAAGAVLTLAMTAQAVATDTAPPPRR